MTLLYIIIGILITAALLFYMRYFIPLRPTESGFEYVYVNEDGTVSELDEKTLNI